MVNSKEIFKSVSNFLFSKANKEFLTFLSFFFMAGIFWLLTALNDTYEQEVRVPVHYVDVPKNAVMTSPEDDTIRVTVSDKGIILLTYLFGDALRGIDIDFSTHSRSRGKGEVQNAELTKEVTQKLNASSKLISIKPDHLTFYYNYGEKKQVPVKWRGTVTPDDLYFISDVTYDPDSITIFASREKLDSINVVYTTMLNQTNFHDTLVVNSHLQHIPGVKMVPDIVTMHFMTDILTEESIDDIPIEGINMPEGKVLRTFPAKVGVRFVTGVKTYQKLSASDFRIIADYAEIESNPTPKCNIYLKQTPANVSRIKLTQKQVDYLIEEQN